jgi:anti-sigma factor RsiW
MSRSLVTESDLQSFVDGATTPARQREVETYLAEHPEQAARVAAYRGQVAALHARFDGVLGEPVPRRLRLAMERRGRPNRLLRVAAAGGWLAVGVAAGWIGRGAEVAAPPRTVQLVRDAALAHAVYVPEVRHPVEVAADQEQHLIGWLSKRLGGEVRPPALGELGYELVGGRLLPGASGPAAQFMYQDASGHRLTLYVRTGASENRQTAFQFAQEGALRVFYWADGPFGYALTGDIEREPLLRVANTVYAQLNP